MNKKALFSMIGLTVLSAGSMVSDTVNAAAHLEARSELEEVFMAEAKSHEILAGVFRTLASAAALDAEGNEKILARVEKFERSAIAEEKLAAEAREVANSAEWKARVTADFSGGRFGVTRVRELMSEAASDRAAEASKKVNMLARKIKKMGGNIEIINEIESALSRIDAVASHAHELEKKAVFYRSAEMAAQMKS